jgi:hypothetical protein
MFSLEIAQPALSRDLLYDFHFIIFKYSILTPEIPLLPAWETTHAFFLAVPEQHGGYQGA